MSDEIACTHSEGCITCSDEAIAMRVVRLGEGTEPALCEGPDGSRSEVLLDLVADPRVGDVVLVHAGVAISGGRPEGAVQALAGPDAPRRQP